MSKQTLMRDLGAVLAAGIISASSAQAQERQSMPRYPITSTPDSGAVINSGLAAKARRLAEYVILSDYETARLQMLVDGQEYTVWVKNANEASGLRDIMRFWVRPEGAIGADNLATLIDDGLVGVPEFVRIPKKQSPNGQEIIYRRGDGKNKEAVEKFYEKALDDMLEHAGLKN